MMRVQNWQPMGQADKTGRWYARDADGMEAWTWHDGYEWTREYWRENADRDEHMTDVWWTPVEYQPGA